MNELERERERKKEWVLQKHSHPLMGLGRSETQEGGDICILRADSLLQGGNQHNIVKQLRSN